MTSRHILIMGASYGSLLGAKFLLAGHNIKLVCQLPEVKLINAEGFRVRLPVRTQAQPVVLDSRKLPGQAFALVPADVKPGDFDLVVLAMQEPQYGSPAVSELLDGIARARVPCLSIMNMPPPPYLKRIRAINYASVASAYVNPRVWDKFDPTLLTMCSADPQAIRPPNSKSNVLEVTLPTNFKVARFDHAPSSGILRQLEQDIDSARLETPDGPIELPVKLRVHDSFYVPLAKWPMLLTGNYRCLAEDNVVDIKDAVLHNIEESRSAYNFVMDVCLEVGANAEDLVAFEKYAAAANSLTRPSSAARALMNGATNIERADKLVQLVARQMGMSHPVIDATVARVDSWLEANRLRPSEVTHRVEGSGRPTNFC